MQADRQNGGRRPFLTPLQNNVNPESTKGQAIQTYNAGASAIQRQAEESLKKINDVVKNTRTIYASSQMITSERDKDILSGYKTSIETLNNDYINAVGSGGLIDQMAIDDNEKFKLKQNAKILLQQKVLDQKNEIKSKKDIYQKIFQTENKFDLALNDLTNKQNEILQKAERLEIKGLQEQNTNLTIDNIKTSINNFAQSTNDNLLIQNQLNVFKMIDDAENGGIISKLQSTQLRESAITYKDDRAIQNTINIAEDLSLKGDLLGAYDEVANSYALIRNNKKYENVSDRVNAETQLRNKMTQYAQEFKSQQLKTAVNYKDNLSVNENLVEIKKSEIYNKTDDEGKKTLETEIISLGTLLETNPSEYYLQTKNPNASIRERQEWMNSIGYGAKTSLSEREINAMKQSFNSIKPADKSNTLDPMTQFKNIINSQVNVFGYSDVKDIFNNNPESNQVKNALKKESALNMKGLTALAIDTYLNQGEDVALPLVNMLAEANLQPSKKLPSKKYFTEEQIDEKQSEYYKTERGKYDLYRGVDYAKERASAFVEISNYTGTKVQDNVLKYTDKNIVFINTETQSLKFDSNIYDPTSIANGIRVVLMNPQSIDKLKELDIVEKIDLRGESGNENLRIKTTEDGNVSILVTSKKGGVLNQYIKTITLKELEEIGSNVPSYLTPNKNIINNSILNKL